MSTLATMRTRIADDLNRSDVNTQIDKAINRAIIYYSKERFWFNETTGTVATVASTQAYGTAQSLPTDILEIDTVKLTIASTNKQVLDKRTYQWLQEMDLSAQTSQPTDWAWYKSSLYLYPTPNAAWTVTLSYMKSYAELSLDADTNDWTTSAEDLIEARARWWLYSRVIMDYEAADRAKAEEAEALYCLRHKTSNLLATNMIAATDF